MANERLAGEWTVAQILGHFPNAAMGFIRLRTACVGCALARFCTMDDVSAAYEMPADVIRASLLDAIAAREPGSTDNPGAEDA